jgi:hypothetical protein
VVLPSSTLPVRGDDLRYECFCWYDLDAVPHTHGFNRSYSAIPQVQNDVLLENVNGNHYLRFTSWKPLAQFKRWPTQSQLIKAVQKRHKARRSSRCTDNTSKTRRVIVYRQYAPTYERKQHIRNMSSLQRVLSNLPRMRVWSNILGCHGRVRNSMTISTPNLIANRSNLPINKMQ